MQLAIMWKEPLYPAGIIDRYTVVIAKDGLSLIVNSTNLSVVAAFDYYINYTISVTPINGFGSGNVSQIIMLVSPQGGKYNVSIFTSQVLFLNSANSSS